MRHYLTLFFVGVLVLSLVPDQNAEARRSGFGGFGRSSFRTSGFGFGARQVRSGKGLSGWGRTSSRGGLGSVFGSRKATPAGWRGGNMSRRVGKAGNVLGSRSEAVSAYRKSIRTKWSKRPSKRPDYVPRSISRGGKSYDVTYRNGGYGYLGSNGAWVALAAGSMLASDVLLARRGYYYGTPYYGGRGSGFSLFSVALLAFFFVSFLGGRARRTG